MRGRAGERRGGGGVWIVVKAKSRILSSSTVLLLARQGAQEGKLWGSASIGMETARN
jgi:hypothetical protein